MAGTTCIVATSLTMTVSLEYPEGPSGENWADLRYHIIIISPGVVQKCFFIGTNAMPTLPKL